MAMKYVNVPHGDMGSGIDQLSSEDSLPEGYSEELVNMDPAPEGYLSKRPGYQGKWGFLPVRVQEVIAGAGGNPLALTFVLDSSIDLTSIPSPSHSRPIVVYGRTSAANTSATGDFIPGTDTAQYYSTFNAAPQVEIAHGTSTFTELASDTGLTQPLVWVGLAQSTSLTAPDWSLIQPDVVAVDDVTDTVSVTVTNGGAAFPGFLFTLPTPAVMGQTYISPVHVFPAGTSTYSIPAATHELANPNIQVKAYMLVGTTLTEIRPDLVVIDTADNVTLTLTNESPGTLSVLFILTDAPAANTMQGSAGPDGSVTVNIHPASTFSFVSCYIEQSLGGPREEVWPDAIVYTSSTNTLAVTFQNNQPSSANFFVYWQPAELASNRLTVTSSSPVTTPFTDLSPELTIWGLDHSTIYGPTAGPHAGWVTELDTYRSTGEQFLVAGLGGNLFSGQAASDAVAASYLIPTLYPSLRARTSVSTLVGPAFLNTLDPTFRTAGHIQADNLAPLAQASSITWDSGTGYMRVLIPLVNGVSTGPNPIITTTGFEDQLTVQAAGWDVQNGTFAIKSANLTPALLTLEVLNPALTSSDFDDQSSGALVGVLTDRLPLTAASPFIPGDILLSQVLVLNEQLRVVASLGSSVLFGGLNAELGFPGGIRVAGKRTSSVIPLRTLTDVASVVDVVTGDNLVLGGPSNTDGVYLRELRVLGINTQVDTAVTITGNSVVGTLVLGAGTTGTFAVGDEFLLEQAGPYTGVQTVASIASTTSLTFLSSATGSFTGTLAGATVQVDESLLWSDTVDSSISAAVPGRWLPLEAPDTTQTETPGPYVSYLSASSYSDQPIVRSVMASDSLFLNNGVDRTLKLDGSSVYRPGLPRWQPELFVAIATSPVDAQGRFGSITIPVTTAPLISPYWVGPNLFVSLDQVNTFLVGSSIQVIGADQPVSLTGTGTVATLTLTAGGVTNASLYKGELFTLSGAGDYTGLHTVTGLVGTTQVTFDSAVTATTTGTLVFDATSTYTVSALLEDTTNNQGVITVGQNVLGVTGPATLQQVVTYSYYFRLNAVDTNRNVVASAAAGSTDWTFHLSDNAAIRMRLVGLPAWDIYDYDRLEVQIYRTKANGVAPFYLLSTLPMSFDAGGGYIDYTDTADDDTLGTLDPVNTALKGQELGTGWSHPIRAQRVTSASNRLVLANLTSDPFIDVTLFNEGGVISTGPLDGLRWLVRKDETDPLTTTDMTNRVGLQWMATGSVGASYASNTSTTFTITTAALAAVGNWVYLFRQAAVSPNQQTHLMGWWQVASVGSGTLTFNWPNALATLTGADEIDSALVAAMPFEGDVPVWLGTDNNYAYTSATLGQDGGADSPAESMAALRLANAINATQRVVDRSLAGFGSFQPWFCCDAGGDFNVGEFILRQVQNAQTVYSLQLPTGYSTFNIFVDNVLRSPAEAVGAISTLYPSRILVSYTNFPEIFDSPLASVDSQSDSAIDVNPADGQEITAVIPFFGDSAFGASLKDAVILVFKTNAVYLVNVAQKVAGANPVQRLETMGLGCTAPNSVTPARTGIFFANGSGIYKLQTDMTLYYMGRHIQRLWRGEGTAGVDIPNLDLAFGHNYAFGSQYKLSVPLKGQTPAATGPHSSVVPNAAFVYNSTREYSFQGITNTIQLYATKEGGWSEQEGFSAIGWASLADDSYYAALVGRVFQLRRTGLAQDFRDDNQPIAATATLRAMDFGDAGVRKSVPYVVLSYRNPQMPTVSGARTGVGILSSVDLSQEFTPADLTLIPENAQTWGTGDYVEQSITTYRYSINEKRGVRFQLQITDSTIDEPLDITKIVYSVAGLTAPKGIREAASGPAPSQNGGE